MNKAIKEKWVAALRSGEYQQTHESLRDEEGHCCLGVLCDIHNQETSVDGWGQAQFQDNYYERSGFLPEIVQEWAELSSDPQAGCHTLSHLNDSGHDFEQIANRIENYL